MHDIALTIANLRKKKGWSQADLEEHSTVSREMISKYERGKAIPSIIAAHQLAESLGVSLDYLMGKGINAQFDSKTVERLEMLNSLDEKSKNTLFCVIDAFIRDAKTRQAYA